MRREGGEGEGRRCREGAREGEREGGRERYGLVAGFAEGPLNGRLKIGVQGLLEDLDRTDWPTGALHNAQEQHGALAASAAQSCCQPSKTTVSHPLHETGYVCHGEHFWWLSSQHRWLP